METRYVNTLLFFCYQRIFRTSRPLIWIDSSASVNRFQALCDHRTKIAETVSYESLIGHEHLALISIPAYCIVLGP